MIKKKQRVIKNYILSPEPYIPKGNSMRVKEDKAVFIKLISK